MTETSVCLVDIVCVSVDSKFVCVWISSVQIYVCVCEHYLVTGTANDRREHGSGGIIPSEARLHQAGAVITHQGCGLLLIAHVCLASC